MQNNTNQTPNISLSLFDDLLQFGNGLKGKQDINELRERLESASESGSLNNLLGGVATQALNGLFGGLLSQPAPTPSTTPSTPMTMEKMFAQREQPYVPPKTCPVTNDCPCPSATKEYPFVATSVPPTNSKPVTQLDYNKLFETVLDAFEQGYDESEEDYSSDYSEMDGCCENCGKQLTSDDLESEYFTTTTVENVTAVSKRKEVSQPGSGQGSIVFLDPLRVKLYMGMNFTRTTMPEYLFSLGPSSISISDEYLEKHNPYTLMVPAGTRYVSQNDQDCIINKTQVAQEFVLEKNFKFTLPKGIVFNYDGEEDQCLCKNTVVALNY